MKIIKNFNKDNGEWVYSGIFDKYYNTPNIYVNKQTLEIVQIRNGVAKCPKQTIHKTNGYLYVHMLTNKNKFQNYRVHRIILFTLEPIPEKI